VQYLGERGLCLLDLPIGETQLHHVRQCLALRQLHLRKDGQFGKSWHYFSKCAIAFAATRRHHAHQCGLVHDSILVALTRLTASVGVLNFSFAGVLPFETVYTF
jgi:hypothetical protein